MEKYRISPEDIEWLKGQFQASEISPKAAEENVFLFSKHFLGVEPFVWQGVFIRAMEEHDLLAAVTPRQCGKSMALSIHALWNAFYNRRPTKNGTTRIAIISSTEEQAMKLLGDIRSLMFLGDRHVEQLTKGKVKKYFTGQSHRKGNTKTHLKFKNGSEIICLPATNAVRGYSLSFVYVDEAAFLEDSNFLEEKVEPTVAFTKGKVILTTTPAGVGGGFYDLFDPDSKRGVHRYTRLWFGKEAMVEDQLQRNLDLLRQEAEAKGKLGQYLQEYEAEFTSSIQLFFSTRKVDAATTDDFNLVHYSNFIKPAGQVVSVGVDFGMTVSKTVITVVAYDEYDKKISVLSQYVYDYGTDAFVVDDVIRLVHSYSADILVIDYCPESYFATEQMRSRGLDPFLFNFRTMKIGAYNGLRQWMNRGDLLIPLDGTDALRFEMKSLREKHTNLTTKIEKPHGGSDDRVDSLMLACYPFLEYSEVDMTATEVFLV